MLWYNRTWSKDILYWIHKNKDVSIIWVEPT